MTEAPVPPTRARRTSPACLVPPLIAALLVGVLTYALVKPAPDTRLGSTLMNAPAPDFTLTALDERPVTLSDLRSKPVVLNFWASWCVPYRQEAPLLRALDDRNGPGDPVLLGLLFQDREAPARAFIQEFNLKYPTLRDPKLATAIDYGVAGVHETFFLDAQGVIRHVDRGGLNRERLNESLVKIGVPALQEQE